MDISPVVLKVVVAVLCVLELIVVPAFIKVGWPERSNRSTLLKCTGSVIFILTAIASAMLGGGMTKIALLMLAGFVLSLIGDFWLDLKMNDKNILMGIIFFFFAHVCYVMAFVTVCTTKLGETSPFNKAELIAVAVIAVLAGIGSLVMKMDMRKLLIPVAIYSITICLMVVKAIYMCTRIYENGTFGISALMLLSVGALLFIISDIVLAFMYFGNKFTKNMRVVNLVTYFGGQMFLAMSLMYIA